MSGTLNLSYPIELSFSRSLVSLPHSHLPRKMLRTLRG